MLSSRGRPAALSGMARTAAQACLDRVIGFDNGRHLDRRFPLRRRLRAGRGDPGRRRAHAHADEWTSITVAAGGGSICDFDGMRFGWGRAPRAPIPAPPVTAGAGRSPSPTATCTGQDPGLGLSQRLRPDGRQPLDGAAVKQRFAELALAVAAAGHPERRQSWPRASSPSPSRNMAGPSSRCRSSVAYDVSAYTLPVSGGAGGQHACLVADALGMKRVMIHPLAGVLSAYGMGWRRCG